MNTITSTSTLWSKKIKSLIFAFFIVCFSSTAQVGIQCDLNHDNIINISDVSLLINIILNHATDAAVEAGICPNVAHPHVIDLGLTSGTKWTCCNVGASNPLEYGDYYAWGEVLTKDSYMYTGKYRNFGDDIAKTEHDVAYIKWESKYSMPTYGMCWELIQECSYEWTTINGVNGGKFTGSNGNYIFLPAAGFRWDISDMEENYSMNHDGRVGYWGCYWSSTIDTELDETYEPLYIFLNTADRGIDFLDGSCGFSVRPVVE